MAFFQLGKMAYTLFLRRPLKALIDDPDSEIDDDIIAILDTTFSVPKDKR